MFYGGVNLKTQPLGIFWSYDPKADTWNQLKANPVPSTTGLRSGSARNSMCSAVSASPIREGSAGIPKTRFGFTTARHKVGRRCRRCRRCGARSPLWAKIPVGMELSDGLTAGGPVEVVGTMEVFDTENIAEPRRSAQRKLPRLPPWRSRTLRSHRRRGERNTSAAPLRERPQSHARPRTLSAEMATWCGQWRRSCARSISPLRRVIAAAEVRH